MSLPCFPISKKPMAQPEGRSAMGEVTTSFYNLVRQHIDPHYWDPNFRIVHIGYDVSGFRYGHWTIGIGSSTPSSPFECFVIRDDGWWDKLADRSYNLIIYDNPKIDFPRLFGLRNLMKKGKNGAILLAKGTVQEIRILKFLLKSHKMDGQVLISQIENLTNGTYFRSIDGLGDLLEVRPSAKRALKMGKVTIECDYKHKWLFSDIPCQVVGAMIGPDKYHQFSYEHDVCVHKPNHRYIEGALINTEFSRLRFSPLFGYDDIQVIAHQTGTLLNDEEIKGIFMPLQNPNPRLCVVCTTSINSVKNLTNSSIYRIVKTVRQKGLWPIVLQIQEKTDEPVQFKDGTLVIRKKLSAHQIQKLMRHAQLFIGLDSGFSHVSSMYRIPTIVFCNQRAVGRWKHYDTTRVCLTNGPVRGIRPSKRMDWKIREQDIEWGLFSRFIDEFNLTPQRQTQLCEIEKLKPESVFELLPQSWFINNSKRTNQNGHIYTGNCYEWLVALARYYRPKSILEIGTSLGFSLGAFIKGYAPEKILSIDDESLYDNTQEIAKMLCESIGFKNGEFRVIDSTSVFQLPQEFDLAHVDGDHSDGSVKHDGYLSKQYAKMILFDDFANPNFNLEQTLALWIVDNLDEIKSFYHVPSYVGILVVELDRLHCKCNAEKVGGTP